MNNEANLYDGGASYKAGEIFFITVVIHELGHVIGILHHKNTSNPLMYEYNTFIRNTVHNLKAYIELYKSKGVVFRSKRASSHLTYYKKKVTVFLIFPDIYELSPPGEFFKIPKDDSVIYFHDGTQWDFFSKEVVCDL